MAETITIPSATVLLERPVAPGAMQSHMKRSDLQSAASHPGKSISGVAEGSSNTRRKQSKSRNGCLTCKAKRLKCDETKPGCQQCARRSVTCGGYKKDFKWRPFEEAGIGARNPNRLKKDNTPSVAPSIPSRAKSANLQPAPGTLPGTFGTDVLCYSASIHLPHAHHFHQSFPNTQYIQHKPRQQHLTTTPYHPILPPTPTIDSTLEGAQVGSSESQRNGTHIAQSTSSGQSPRLVDLLSPGTDLHAPPEEYMSFREQHEAFYEPSRSGPADESVDDEIDEVPRHFEPAEASWSIRAPSSGPSESSESSSSPPDHRLYLQPQFSIASPEMMTRRFDRETCGVLSVKDGPTENPWRTLVWPLARDCPALYHAIASMTSFHQSRDTPALRIQGIDHMRTAVHALASSMENMRVDAAISTTLALAFSESWDQHISTGINHIKGAKILIDRALVKNAQKPVYGEEFARLKFLCNSWVYIDVIARLTSAENDESNDYDGIFDSFHMNGQNDAELDPLMGCASTLFPIIGRVANLVRRVRRTDGNGPAIISQALDLKRQVENWEPPSHIEDPEDETTSVYDSIATATAYRYATLLYLHQAVPEIPSIPSADLARKICAELATVPPRSRSIIVHIFPLMAAGCEVLGDEDRKWVCDRWELMSIKMKLGIIEKCLEVTKEVWSRRDAYMSEAAMSDAEQMHDVVSMVPNLKRTFDDTFDGATSDEDFSWLDPSAKRRAVNSYFVDDRPRPVTIKSETSGGMRRSEVLGTETLDHEFTVKGRLHWLGVMQDWNWEILLG